MCTMVSINKRTLLAAHRVVDGAALQRRKKDLNRLLM